MSAAEPTRRGFRQRPPPFLKYLQSILRKYPDGGQILKELIQNADDARATEVIFLCDERSYGTHSLAAEGLQRAQGPALVAYNDGLFSEADWDGIQSTGDSHKLRDPGTVGRFGLGFNSVYHLTDLPAVLSGPWLGVLDPQRAALPDGGQQWHLEEAAGLADQFAPYWGALEALGRGGGGGGAPPAGRFPGTLFRFPLRREPSGVSDNLYSPQRVRQLFLAFLPDAPACLLFLRHVRRLALVVVDGRGAATELLEATAAPRPLNGPALLRDPGAALATAACVKALAVRGAAAEGAAEGEWLVVSASPAQGAFPELERLAGALGSAAGVALAYPLGGGRAGHLCCFLPLPATEENATGLPVHVNAPFHLTDDRRHVQWAEGDRRGDPGARWNQLLTEEVLPLAYRQALTVAAAACPGDPYGAWPDPELCRHQQRYRSLAGRICRELWGMEALVPAGRPGPRRLRAADALFLPRAGAGEATLRALEEALLGAGEPLVVVPAHVRRALAAGGPAVREATPAHVRGVLRRAGCPAAAERRLLLEYVAGDGAYGELAGLELLPQADGGFACFGGPGGAVYADSEAFPRILLPGLADNFLPEDLTPALQTHLHRMAEQGLFRNLVALDPAVIERSLKGALPAGWFDAGSAHVTWCPDDPPRQPPRQWLVAFWDFLQHHVRSLAGFEGHPLVPLSPPGNGARSVWLARLSPRPTLLFQTRDGHSLTEEESGLLEALGCTVIRSWDPAFWHRQLADYVLAPTAGNALRAFDHLGVAGVAARLASLPPDRRRILCRFLSQAPASSLSEREAAVLGSLPIFQKMPSLTPPCPAGLVPASSYRALERNTVPAVPEDLVLPVPVLRCRDEADRRLLLQARDSLLGAAELARLAVRAVKKGEYARRAPDAERLMLWVLRHGDALFGQSQKLQTLCEELAFMDRGGSPARADELFDPENGVFRALLSSRCFPPAAFREAAVLRSLRALGLKTSDAALTPDLLLEAAEAVGRLQRAGDAPGAAVKSRALIELCNRTPALARFSQKTLQRLRDLAWVPATDPAERQPNGPFLAPERLRSARYAHLAGLAMALTDAFGERAEEKLGLCRPPPLEKVVENLLCLARGYQPKDIRTLTAKLHAIYQHLQQHLGKFQVASRAVIWTGTGFSLPAKVVLSYPDGLDLSCLMARVPQEFLPYRRLFLAWGARDAVGEEELSQALRRMGEEMDGRPGGGTEAELRLAVAVLEWLKSRGHRGHGELPVPVQVPGGSAFALRPASSALYCDIDRASLADLEGEDAELAVVHEAVPPATAAFLGAALLSTRVLQPQLFEPWGPSEPITTRIWNILREYSEEADLFKELIQNAEDAGARACSFLLDLRRHGGGAAGLLDAGMAACQGPALWSYNDAPFTREDLTNITRVGAATKEGQEGKIGKFGLGFNTVYHVTDVPSVLSGGSLLIFDPNVTHLRKHIPNPACPGIRLDLRARPATLSTFAEQFRPYRGLFGFQAREPFDFPGTLFRLPFRTEEEARESRISQAAFGPDRIERLQSGFRDFCHLLLLFLRGVREVGLERLPNGAPSPEATQPLARLCRKRIKSLEGAGDPETSDSSIEQLTVQWEADGTISHFLVHTCLGTGESLALFQRGMSDGVRPSPPSAGVALPLAPTEAGKWAPRPDSFEGRVFCFLPLPIASGLPVHLHGAFAVLSNRKGLWEAAAKGEWNRALLRDAVPAAWLRALSLLRDMHRDGELEGYEYHAFWPDAGKARHPFTEAAKAFYRALATSRDLALFSDGRQWRAVDSACFLDSAVTQNPRVGPTAARVFAELLPEPLLAVELPNWVRAGFQASGHEDALLANTYGWLRFYQEMVFANLATLDPPDRDALILHALDMGDGAMDQLLASVSCIPTAPLGQLQPAGRLVHPLGRAAPLYDPQDGRFPTGAGFLAPARLLRLEGLGLAKDAVPLKELTERARTVEALWRCDHRRGCRRIRCVLELLEPLLERGSDNTAQVAFRAIPFLPAALPGAHRQLCRPADLYHHEHRSLVGLVQPVLASEDLGGDFRFSKALQDFLGLSRQPPAGAVLRQLAAACRGSNALPEPELRETARRCYAYLDELLREQPGCQKEVAEEAAAFPFVLAGAHFVPVKAVARALSFEASPYLHPLPEEYGGFGALWGCVGLRETFALESYAWVLRELAGKTARQPLSPEDLQLVLRLVTVGLMEAALDGRPVEAYEAQGLLFPDQQGVLRPAAKLHFDDTPWLPREEGTPLCHGRIPRELALRYGVPTTRHRALARGKIRGLELAPWASEFGAREELTVRLRNILREYSSSSRDVLKELLQNADDAGASRIHFVWDRRRHPTRRVFSEEWGSLQGPALCVYNDKPLTQEDIEGIQRLGVGAKGGRQDKTGKYGLGFNTVYHLTDCPAFVTGDSALGVFDPHLRYLPTASEQNPGAMFSVNGDFKKTFPDVYTTFLPGLFDLSQGVLFRLPLRTAEGAAGSRVCQRVVHEEELEEMQAALAQEAESLVLFLHHLRTVVFSEIAEGEGQPRELLRVETEMEEGGVALRRAFQERLSHMAVAGGEEATPARELYTMKVSVSHGSRPPTSWGVVWQAGVDDAAKEESPDPARLPYGAVAACLDAVLPGRAFCTLPLPQETGLPVHINGNFSVDAARRDLRKEDEGSWKTAWNRFLMQQLLAPLYCQLLEWLRKKLGEAPGFRTLTACCETLEPKYLGYFPAVTRLVPPAWHQLVSRVYQLIAETQQPLIPVYRMEPTHHHVPSAEMVRITWTAPRVGRLLQEPFFLREEAGDAVSCVLQRLEMKLVPAFWGLCQIHAEFIRADVEVRTLTPASLRHFLKALPLHLPCQVSATPLKDKDSCSHLLEFCLEGLQTGEVGDLEGLPLSVTRDGMLRQFRTWEPVFQSSAHHLFPRQQHQFLSYHVDHELLLLLLQAGFLKEFTLQEAARFTQEVLGQPDWEARSEEARKWLKEVWKLFDRMIYRANEQNEEAMAKAFRELVSLFKDWAILPVCSDQPGEEHLVHMASLPTIIHGYSSEVEMSLGKLGFAKLDVQMVPLQITLHCICPLLLQTDDPVSVLKQLVARTGLRWQELKSYETSGLLRFLSQKVEELTDDLLVHLRSLPLFRTQRGTWVALACYCNFYILDTKIPKSLKAFQALYELDQQTVLLQDKPLHRTISKGLGIGILNDLQQFVRHLLPRLPRLPESQLLEALRLLFIIKSCYQEEYQAEKKTIISAFRPVRFIRDSQGALHPASYFYDGEVTLFQTLRLDARFVPEAFFEAVGVKKYRMNSFLREAGMKWEVSEDDFVEFATRIEQQAVQTGAASGDLPAQRQALLLHLLSRPSDSLSDRFLERVSSIRFLAPQRVPDELGNFHPPCVPHTQPMAPKGALVIPRDEDMALVWTSARILALPFVLLLKDAQSVLERLGVLQAVPAPVVLGNLKNVCQAPCETKQMQKTRTRVFMQTYGYLERDLSGFDASGLAGLPVVLVKEDQVAEAGQVVFSLRDELEFRPYLYTLPPLVAVYSELLQKLGVEQEPSVRHYAGVLRRIHRETQEKEALQPNLTKTVLRATQHLFQLLRQKRADFSGVEDLHLPCADGKLYPSNTLVFNDCLSTCLSQALGRTFRFLLDLSRCHLPFEDYSAWTLLRQLPQPLRPRFLSEITELRLEEASLELCPYGELCERRNQLQGILVSPDFREGLAALLRWQERDQEEEAETARRQREAAFSTEQLEVVCSEKIRTVMLHRGERLEGSQAFRVVHVVLDADGRRRVYLLHQERVDRRQSVQILGCLAQEVDGILGGVLHSKSLQILMQMLACQDPGEVQEVLEENEVPLQPSTHPDAYTLPSPGTEIPQEWHDSLDMSILNTFAPGDYVGYLDPAAPEECYQYAVVLEVLPGGEVPMYRIDLGDGRQEEASANDLYQFKRSQPEGRSRALVPVPDLRQHRARREEWHRQSLGEVKQEVDASLAKIWALPTGERQKAIRRLYLRYHPDKNMGQEELANEVCKYLRERIQELEEGKKRPGGGRHPDSHQGFSASWQEWDGQARRHRQNRREFTGQRGQGFRYDFWSYHQDEAGRRPQAEEAGRWFRQAQSDLRAADHDVGQRCTNWVFYKVYRAVEKALAAAMYSRGERFERGQTLAWLAQKVAAYEPGLQGLPAQVAELRRHGVDDKTTQYPSYHTLPTIPGEAFPAGEEQKVLRLAQDVLDVVQVFVARR